MRFLSFFACLGVCLSVVVNNAWAKARFTWSYDDPSLTSLYVPAQGAGFLLAVPVWATDPSTENWKSLGRQNAVLSGAEPAVKLFPSIRWAVALPITPQLDFRMGSATRLHLQYQDSRQQQMSSPAGVLYSQANGELDYQAHLFAFRLKHSFWYAELNMTHHALDLQAVGGLNGVFAQTPVYQGQWSAAFAGSAWTPGFKAGLSWVEIALDFSALTAVYGDQRGEWQVPEWANPMTGKPDPAQAWQAHAPVSTHQRSSPDTLRLALPKQLRVTLRPNAHLEAEYSLRRGSFALLHPASADAWKWTRYVQGELFAGHQLLIKSPWHYGYAYAGAQLLSSSAKWEPMSDLLPHTLLPQAGFGLTLGTPYRVLVGAELLPAIRLILGVQYAP